MSFDAMLDQMKSKLGFVAALDQSGGSTRKALTAYGISEDAYTSDDEMFDLMHAMRTRIATSASFTGDKVIGAILFEMTMDRQMEGKPTAQYMWEDRNVVPFLKVDKGLEEEQNGVQLMKPIPSLSETLTRAKDLGIFGTKMRSLIKSADQSGIVSNVAQQFVIGDEIINHGLVPILEPEVDINAPDKAAAEALLRREILGQLDAMPSDRNLMLKLTLPEEADFYRPLVDHDRVIRVLALSGGYSQSEANSKLASNSGVIASYSRALSEGLSADQSDPNFHDMISASIKAIFSASST